MIIFPDPVPLIRAYLKQHLPDIHISGEVPKKIPAEMVTIITTGGVRQNIAYETALLAVQAWSDSGAKASKLARRVCALLRAWPDEPNSPAWVQVSVPYEFSDPDSTKSRYQMTVQATFRPEEE